MKIRGEKQLNDLKGAAGLFIFLGDFIEKKDITLTIIH